MSNEVEEISEVLPETQEPTVRVSMTDAAFKSTSIALVEKLLQFSTPRLDSKIVNVLFLEGITNNIRRRVLSHD
jgi:3-dehydroquinate dehydratase